MSFSNIIRSNIEVAVDCVFLLVDFVAGRDKGFFFHCATKGPAPQTF